MCRDSSCDIQMAGSEFGINNTEALILPCSTFKKILRCLFTLWLQCTHPLIIDNAPCNKVQIASDWFREHDNDLYSHQISIQRTPLEWGGTGHWHCGYAGNVRYYHVYILQNLWEISPALYWIFGMKK